MARSDRVRLSGDRIKAASPHRTFGASAIFGVVASESPEWCALQRAVRQVTSRCVSLPVRPCLEGTLPGRSRRLRTAAAGHLWPAGRPATRVAEVRAAQARAGCQDACHHDTGGHRRHKALDDPQQNPGPHARAHHSAMVTHRLHGIMLHLSASRAVAVPRGPYRPDRDDQEPGWPVGQRSRKPGVWAGRGRTLAPGQQESLDPAWRWDHGGGRALGQAR